MSSGPPQSVERLLIERIPGARAASTFAQDVRKGFTSRPKSLPPKYFYDEMGSHLFEAICCLPEYYVTRTETEILERRSAEILSSLSPTRLVELGSGSSVKSRLLIAAVLEGRESLTYLPIDVSATALEASSRRLLQTFPGIRVRAFESDYEAALERLAAERQCDDRQPTMVLFLGSSIGNLEPEAAVELLERIRTVVGPGDGLLLGVDLAKSEELLIPAYDDALGVTAAFNLNLLQRINRELGGAFDVRAFRHRARFNREASRIELHLVSRRRQTVPVRDLGLEVDFEEGESIHTESSYKYEPTRIAELAGAGGFAVTRSWRDEGRLFSLNLLSPR